MNGIVVAKRRAAILEATATLNSDAVTSMVLKMAAIRYVSLGAVSFHFWFE